MSQTSSGPEVARWAVGRDIQRATRKRHSAEEKARIVLDGLRGGCTCTSSTSPPTSTSACRDRLEAVA